jgi:3-hydroxyisobutyrate dehydrogenase
MGRAIAKRLIDVGHDVTVWNRTPGKADALIEAGAVAAASPRELAQRADVILTILTDAGAIADVYEGSAGLLESLHHFRLGRR